MPDGVGAVFIGRAGTFRWQDALEWFFGAVDYFQMLDIRLAEFLADDFRQWVIDGLEDVGHTEQGGIQLVGGTHAGKQRSVLLVATEDEVELCLDRINTVNHVVIKSEIELVGIVRQVESPVLAYNTVGIDGMDAFFSHIDLILSYRLGGGKELPVDIGRTHTVVVDDVNSPHAAACKHFDSIASYAPDSEDRHAAAVEGVDSGSAKEKLGS